jgi:hypothetical protein
MIEQSEDSLPMHGETVPAVKPVAHSDPQATFGR